MKKTLLAFTLVFTILLAFTVSVSAQDGRVIYRASAITDTEALNARIGKQIDERSQGAKSDFIVEGQAVIQNRGESICEEVPTTTQLLSATVYRDGTVVNQYVTATRASSSKSGHAEAGTLDVWAFIYWSERRDALGVKEYRFDTSTHFYVDSGNAGVIRMNMENYVGYNDYDIQGATSTKNSPANNTRYAGPTNSYNAWISGGQGGHYEAFTYVVSTYYGTTEAYVRFYTPAA